MSRRFFGLLCAHKWHTIGRLYSEDSRSGAQSDTGVILQCEHCGDIRRRKLVA